LAAAARSISRSALSLAYCISLASFSAAAFSAASFAAFCSAIKV
jgi:hypothetical protein